MNHTDIQKLEIKIREFVKQQPGYENYPNESSKAPGDGPAIIGVIFGDNILEGIEAFGESVDEAFEDFVLNWERYKGFKWIEKDM